MSTIETTYNSGLTAVRDQRNEDGAVAETLLGTGSRRPPLGLVALGIGIYAATLTAALTINFKSEPVVLEAPVDMVYEEPAVQEPSSSSAPTTGG